jgi:uncharacterized protein YqhQ
MEIVSGQALLEGVAMRSTHWRVAAVRRASGRIEIATGRMAREKLLGIPFVRSLVTWFVDSPTEMQWAAEKVEEDQARGDAADESPPNEHHDYRGSIPATTHESLPPPRTRRVTSVLLMGVLLGLPQIATELLLRLVGVAAGPTSLPFHACIAAITIALAAAYLGIVGRAFPDLRRTFEYNAAFKKALWSARDEEPSAETIARRPSWHYQSAPTSFVLVNFGLALLAPPSLAWMGDRFLEAQGFGARQGVLLAVRLVLVPFVVIVVEELARVLARCGHDGAIAVLFRPMTLLDRLVTRPPKNEDLVLAATVLRELKKLERKR